MASAKGTYTIVVPVSGFVTLPLAIPKDADPNAIAAAEINRLLGEIDFAVAIGKPAGRSVMLQIDPVEERSPIVVGGENPSTQDASRARARAITRRKPR